MKAVERRCSDIAMLVTCCTLPTALSSYSADVAEKTSNPAERCPGMPGGEGSNNLDETFKAIYLWAQKAEALRSANSAKWWDSLAPNPCALISCWAYLSMKCGTPCCVKEHRGITQDTTHGVMESRFTRHGECEQMSWSHCFFSSLQGFCCLVLNQLFRFHELVIDWLKASLWVGEFTKTHSPFLAETLAQIPV